MLLHAVQRGVTVHNYSEQERIQLYILSCSEYVQDYLGSRYRQHESKSTVNSIKRTPGVSPCLSLLLLGESGYKRQSPVSRIDTVPSQMCPQLDFLEN